MYDKQLFYKMGGLFAFCTTFKDLDSSEKILDFLVLSLIGVVVGEELDPPYTLLTYLLPICLDSHVYHYLG